MLIDAVGAGASHLDMERRHQDMLHQHLIEGCIVQ